MTKQPEAWLSQIVILMGPKQLHFFYSFCHTILAYQSLFGQKFPSSHPTSSKRKIMWSFIWMEQQIKINWQSYLEQVGF